VLQYSFLFMLCSLFEVISLAIKEGLVRSQPLNQEKFNFKIAVSQLVIGILMTPIVIAISVLPSHV